jgi:putative transposase
LVQYHIILVCKYRHKLLDKLGELIKSLLVVFASKTNVVIEVVEVDTDHIHVLLNLNSLNFNVEKWIIQFKKYTTIQLYHHSSQSTVSYLRKFFWYKNTFWSDGAFVASIGNVSETVKKYIEQQG